MTNLVVCLGYDLKNDGSILPVLENRLIDSIKLCRDNSGSTLLLMGGHTFRITNKNIPDQSSMMEKYIRDNAQDILATTKIILENTASSTVEQLCSLREFISKKDDDFKLTIVGSQFFTERVRLYSEYILENSEDTSFVASDIPGEDLDTFRQIEEDKLIKACKWLSKHSKGGYLSILKEQKIYEQKIIRGEVTHPVS